MGSARLCLCSCRRLTQHAAVLVRADSAGPELAFPPIPSFSPELFAYMRCAPNQKKAFNKGIEGLLGEGAVQVGCGCGLVHSAVLCSRCELPITAQGGAMQQPRMCTWQRLTVMCVRIVVLAPSGAPQVSDPTRLCVLLPLAQVLYSQDEYVTDPILAAVGQLQFEVGAGAGLDIVCQRLYGLVSTAGWYPRHCQGWLCQAA